MRARGNLSEARRLEGRRTRIPARIIRNDKCMIYVRYADDFLIAFSRTSRLEAVRLKDELGEYLEQTLSFDLREENSKMTNLNREKALFLGTYVSCPPASRWHSTAGDRKNTLCAGIMKRVRSKLRSPKASIRARLCWLRQPRRTNHQALSVLGAQHDRSHPAVWARGFPGYGRSPRGRCWLASTRKPPEICIQAPLYKIK